MTLPISPSVERIVELYEAGLLADELGTYHERVDNLDVFATRCVEAHNAGRIDLMQVVHQPAFAALASHDFFAVQRFYCEAIPELTTGTSAMLSCCAMLVDRAGADLSAGFPTSALTAWLARNPQQSTQVIESAEAGDELALRFAACALQALPEAGVAMKFVADFQDSRRLPGMAALGRIALDADEARDALALLRPLVAGDDDTVRARALSASFDILDKHPDAAVGTQLVASATQAGGGWTLHELASLAFRGNASLDTSGLKVALDAMSGVPAEHAGTIRTLDGALHRLLGKTQANLALDCLTALLEGRTWKTEHFSSTMHALEHGDAQRRHACMVRWLLADSVALGMAAAALAREKREGEFDATLTLPALTEAERVLLGRKALGYLFLQPKTCCEVFVSAIRGAGEVAQRDLAALLFDPMLVSYGGARAWLSSVAPEDEVHPVVQGAVQRFDAYRAALDAVPDIQELRPSAHQRYVVRKQRGEQMRASFERAEKTSLIRQLVHTSHLLHGRRSLSYVRDENGPRALPIELRSHSAYIEVPALEWLDPVGLSMVMRLGKVSKLR